MKIGGQEYTQAQVAQYFAGKTPQQIAADAAQLGLTLDQVAQVAAFGGVSGGNVAAIKDNIRSFINDSSNGYSLSTSGKFMSNTNGAKYVAPGEAPMIYDSDPNSGGMWGGGGGQYVPGQDLPGSNYLAGNREGGRSTVTGLGQSSWTPDMQYRTGASQGASSLNVNGTVVGRATLQDFYARGGNDVQWLRDNGITDPAQIRAFAMQARDIAGNAQQGDAALQSYYNMQKASNPGADFNQWKAGLGFDQRAMEMGVYMGAGKGLMTPGMMASMGSSSSAGQSVNGGDKPPSLQNWTLDAKDFLSQVNPLMAKSAFTDYEKYMGGRYGSGWDNNDFIPYSDVPSNRWSQQDGTPQDVTLKLDDGRIWTPSGHGNGIVFHQKGEVTQGNQIGMDGGWDGTPIYEQLVNPEDYYEVSGDASRLLGKDQAGQKVTMRYKQVGDQMVPMGDPIYQGYKQGWWENVGKPVAGMFGTAASMYYGVGALNGAFGALGAFNPGAALGNADKLAMFGPAGYGAGMTAAELAAAGVSAADIAAAGFGANTPGAVGSMFGAGEIGAAGTGLTAGNLLTGSGVASSLYNPGSVIDGAVGAASTYNPGAVLDGATGATTGTGGNWLSNLLGPSTGATGTGGTDWSRLLTGGLSTAGSLLNGQSAQNAASTQADAQIRAAQIAADAAKFRPVGVKTNFGQSQFGYDQNGNLNSAGYTLDPLLQGQLGQLAGASGGLMNQFTGSQAATAPMAVAAQRAMQLGNQYLGTSPQEQAAKYMAEQQGLLAPGRADAMANLQAQMQAQGRGGFAMGGGVNGQGAANPQMQALYNARMQQDAQLAAQSTQGGMDYAKFGTGMVGTGGDMLNSMYGTQAAAFNPYLTALGGAQKIEGLGQNAMQLGMDLGGKVTAGNAAGGLLMGQGMSNAANTIGANAAQTGSLWGNLLQNGARELSNYKWGT